MGVSKTRTWGRGSGLFFFIIIFFNVFFFFNANADFSCSGAHLSGK